MNPTTKRTPNYTTALMAGEINHFFGCTCAVFFMHPPKTNDAVPKMVIMPYGTPTIDQWERLHKLSGVYCIIDQKAWAITPKGEDYQVAKAHVLGRIESTTIYAVRLKQYGYEVTEARIYSLPLKDHTEILNRKARNCVMLFLTPTEAQTWATAQGAKKVIFEQLNALS